ncbi:MAG: hypothetical protein WDA22_12880 [Bacteroidota bacterium]
MKSLKIILLIFTISLFMVDCSSSDETVGAPTSSSGDCPNGRSGAKCKDGSSSTATGSGACSSHGGVNYWICK